MNLVMESLQLGFVRRVTEGSYRSDLSEDLDEFRKIFELEEIRTCLPRATSNH